MARVPKYRRHSLRDKGFLVICRRRIYLPGKYGSQESRNAYLQHLAGMLAEEQAPPTIATVAVLAVRFLDWARGYYGNTEYDCLRDAIRVLVAEHKAVLLEDFGPMMLRRVRSRMVAAGWSRNYVNHQVARLRRVFKWGVEHELVPPTVLQGLQAVAPLRAGRTEAPETEPVQPVDLAHVEATAAVCTPVVAAMIRLQAATGMRSANLVTLKPGELDTSADVWLYRPPAHKSAWRGRVLVVPLGPRAQRILSPFLDRAADAYCFSPRESEQTRRSGVSRRIGEQYNTASYRQAVGYGCKRAGVPVWTPHQLRHTVATAVRARYGLEAAQVYLGHGHADVTQLYTARDSELACSVARSVG